MTHHLQKVLSTLVIVLLLPHLSYAQNWVSGYSYRKKITINKNKVSPTVIIYGNGVTENKDLVDFPVLIELTGDDLVHIPGDCGNKIQNAEGRDITFTLTGSTTPLNFQLDSYDALTGKLTCWVKIPSLSAEGSPTTATSLYFYYGSATLHDPLSSAGFATWSPDYTRIWHMNKDKPPASVKNARSNVVQQELAGNAMVDAGNFVDSKLAKGIMLDGQSESYSSGIENSTTLTISAWVKLKSIGTEQMIIANDSSRLSGSSTVVDGYKLKVNASGQPVFELYRSSTLTTSQGTSFLLPNTWYYFCGQSTGEDISLAINGIKVAGKTGSTQRVGAGGSIKVGSSKQGGNFLNGEVDEVRIQTSVRKLEWLKTEYANQINPQEFYTISAEEYNPSVFTRFTGSKSNAWNDPANWSNGSVPGVNANIIVATGKTADLSSITMQVLGKVILEAGANWIVKSEVEVNCTASIAKNSIVKIENNAVLKFKAGIVNHGSITSGQAGGKLVFAGNHSQIFSGDGTARVYNLEVNMAASSGLAHLLTPIDVYGQVLITKGILNANARLTLLSSQSGSASIGPINTEANIEGEVQVQHYISGDFPNPATARGWRLLSSPVFNHVANGTKYYDYGAFKKSMFITGKGGTANGFDQSPLNGNTIFTHDQSLPGTLSQKFVAIESMHSKSEAGKGVYVFSRGSRNADNAYASQIEKAPFSNPSGYTITHIGQVYSGNLTVAVANKGNSEDGDGFNLLGNPYPATLTWGALHKTNLNPFIWMFDPLNNSYFVSDDPATLIPPGTGFFVKVNSERTSGSVTFTEGAKFSGAVAASMSTGSAKSDYIVPKKAVVQLVVALEREKFKQEYKLLFTNSGKDEVNDQDALKIGDGFVNIAGMAGDTKLSIDERAAIQDSKQVKLYVNGWASGGYTLEIKGIESFRDMEVTLADNYANKQRILTANNSLYHFNIDTNDPRSFGTERFIIQFAQKKQDAIPRGTSIVVYPNPFLDKLYIRTNQDSFAGAVAIVRNILGKVVLKEQINPEFNNQEINTTSLPPGAYLFQLIDPAINKTLATFKVLKN